VRHSST